MLAGDGAKRGSQGSAAGRRPQASNVHIGRAAGRGSPSYAVIVRLLRGLSGHMVGQSIIDTTFALLPDCAATTTNKEALLPCSLPPTLFVEKV